MFRSLPWRVSICQNARDAVLWIKDARALYTSSVMWAVGSAMAPRVVGGCLGVEESSNQKDEKEVQASLAACVRPDGCSGSREVVVDRRPGACSGRALAAPRDAGPYAGRRGRDRRAAIRGHHRRREPGARRQTAGGGTVARDLLRQRRGHGGPEAARGAQARGGAGQGGVPGSRTGPPGVEAGGERG